MVNPHYDELVEHSKILERKPLIREVYLHMLQRAVKWVVPGGLIVEHGCGLGLTKQLVPSIVLSDYFQHPWMERLENIYQQTFADGEVSTTILMDVFHHLERPKAALLELARTTKPGGRLVIIEPYMSILGLFVYSLCHHEPLGIRKKINWESEYLSEKEPAYYAATANITRILRGGSAKYNLDPWNIIYLEHISSLQYVASGGYKGPQLYPMACIRVIESLDSLLCRLPQIFSTRALVVLEKGKTVDQHGAQNSTKVPKFHQ